MKQEIKFGGFTYKKLREMETTRGKEAGKLSNLDHLVISHPIEKKLGEAIEGKKERILLNQIRNNETCLLELHRNGRKLKDGRD